jgi:hypothetical protein
LVFAGLYRLFPKICDALAIVKPDTIVRLHRALLRGQGTSSVDLYWAGCIINMSGFDLRQAQVHRT